MPNDENTLGYENRSFTLVQTRAISYDVTTVSVYYRRSYFWISLTALDTGI